MDTIIGRYVQISTTIKKTFGNLRNDNYVEVVKIILSILKSLLIIIANFGYLVIF